MEGHYNKKHPDGVGHVGIYLGDGKVIHAKSEKVIRRVDYGKVRIDKADFFTKDPNYRGARRILNLK